MQSLVRINNWDYNLLTGNAVLAIIKEEDHTIRVHTFARVLERVVKLVERKQTLITHKFKVLEVSNDLLGVRLSTLLKGIYAFWMILSEIFFDCFHVSLKIIVRSQLSHQQTEIMINLEVC